MSSRSRLSGLQNTSRFNLSLLGFQLRMLLLLVGALIGVAVIEFFHPSFFDYPFFWKGASTAGVLAFWPLLVYGFFMSFLSAVGAIPTKSEGEVFLHGLTTSVLAGVWEEMGYRWLFICYAMIGLAIANFLWTFIPVVVLLVLVILIVGGNWERSERYRVTTTIPTFWQLRIRGLGRPFLLVGGMILCGIIIAIGFTIDPVYWFYRTFLVTIVDLVTFGQMHYVLHGAHAELFVFGLIVTNAWFRDGHKYQGWYGVANAWVCGFVLMYAMLTYGLLTAVIVHAVYDIEFDVVRYVMHWRGARGVIVRQAKRRVG